MIRPSASLSCAERATEALQSGVVSPPGCPLDEGFRGVMPNELSSSTEADFGRVLEAATGVKTSGLKGPWPLEVGPARQ